MRKGGRESTPKNVQRESAVSDRDVRRSYVPGFHCWAIAIAIGIGIGIVATFTLVIASHFVGATVDFDTDQAIGRPKTSRPTN